MKISNYDWISIYPSLESAKELPGAGYRFCRGLITKVLVVVFVLMSLFIGITDANSANHYVRAGTIGSNNGNDWTNAYTTLPATLTRGDTYYVANGAYGSYTFGTPVSGTTYIYIKKATVADHGTATGWSDAYGVGQATFTGTLGAWTFSTGYWNVSGNTGSGRTGLGFVLHTSSATGSQVITIGNVSNIILDRIEAYNAVTSCDTVTDLNAVIYATSGGSNLTVQNSYLHESNSWAMIGLISWNTVVFDNNQFANACRKELISSRNNTNLTFKNNIVENIAGTGYIVSDNANGYYIYNNVFYTTNSMYTTTDCLFCNWYGNPLTSNNVNIIGNTFYNLRPETVIGYEGGTNINVINNIFYGFSPGTRGNVTTHDYNWCYPPGSCSWVSGETHGQVGASSPFVNAGVGDFHLSVPTNSGQPPSSPYTTDLLGVTRGTDGVWDRGAYEYVSGSIGKKPVSPSIMPIY